MLTSSQLGGADIDPIGGDDYKAQHKRAANCSGKENALGKQAEISTGSDSGEIRRGSIAERKGIGGAWRTKLLEMPVRACSSEPKYRLCYRWALA